MSDSKAREEVAGVLAEHMFGDDTARMGDAAGQCTCDEKWYATGGSFLATYRRVMSAHHSHVADVLLASPALARLLAEVRAEALREAADDMDDTDDPDAIYVSNGDIDLWLRARADRIARTTAHPTDDHAGEAK